MTTDFLTVRHSIMRCSEFQEFGANIGKVFDHKVAVAHNGLHWAMIKGFQAEIPTA